MATRMQQRRGTAEQWTLADPVLAAGEIGFETDTGKFKIGDGVNFWFDLPYFDNSDTLAGSLDDYVLLTDVGVNNGVASLDATGNVPLSQLGNIIDGAPGVLDTLNELAAALNDDADFFTTINGSISSGDSATLASAQSYADGLAVNYDAAGAADAAQIAAESYADGLASNYDPAGSAAAAQSAAESYADGLAVNYDAVGSADAAEAAANAYTDSLVGDVTVDGTAGNTVTDRIATAVANLVDTAPAALDTLNELAAALGDDPNFATTVANQIGTKADAVHTHAISDVTNLQTTLDGKQAAITGGATTITSSNLTTSRAIVSDGSGKVAVSAVTSTELGYLGGVTSAVQTQLNGKLDEVNGAVTTASTSSTVVRNITLSTSDPSGGVDGQVWLKYKN